MDEFDGVLIMLHEAGGHITGRTTIQKIGYFSTITGAMDAHYRPHFYGPYSADIAGAMHDLISYGFIEEKIDKTGYPGTSEMKRYTYNLTTNGEKVVKDNIESYSAEIEKIKEIITISKKTANLDSKILSWAAKIHYIETTEGKELTPEEIHDMAETLNWNLSEPQIQKGKELLRELGLSKR